MSPILAPQKSIHVRNSQKTARPDPSRKQSPKAHGNKRVLGVRKIVMDSLPIFSRKLSAMLVAGMPIARALKSLEKQSANPRFKSVVSEIRASVENGLSLSAAMRRFPTIFDDLYVSMVSCGESGGRMPEAIKRLAGFLEANAKMRRRIKSAMVYPVTVAFIALLISTAMILFIVPVFSDMFSELQSDLPAPTQWLIDFSEAVKRNGVVAFLLIVGLVVAFRRWRVTRHGAYTLDRIALRTPVFGNLKRGIASARFARSFAELIRSGVPILRALDVVAPSTGSKVATDVVLRSKRAVEEGRPLSSGMAGDGVFPDMVVEMLQAGEDAGRVDEMMDCVADFYEDEVSATLDGLASLLEPMLMVFIGVVIGGVVVCLFLPIFTLPKALGL